jgi:hypothetical protein
MKISCWLIIAIAFVVIAAKPATAKPKGKVPCQKVFVTGTQAYAVAWANKNLAEKTDDCIIPVASTGEAEAILVLNCNPKLVGAADYPVCPGKPSEQGAESSDFYVTCNSVGGFETCEDSDGNEYYSDCFWNRFGGISCSFGSGPSPLHALSAALATALLKNSAWAYLFDKGTHKLLWSYKGTGVWSGGIELDADCKHRVFQLVGPRFCKKGKPMAVALPRDGGR